MTTADLSAEVLSLRDQLADLRSTLLPPSLAMHVFQGGPYLGQGATIIVSVADSDLGAPVGGAALTLVTSFGELSSADKTQRGNSITLQTSTDGTAQATLRVPLPDGMEAEQSALDAAVRGLDPNARTPADDTAGLSALARQYSWEANVALRNAIDEYLSEFGRGLHEALTVRDFQHQWPIERGTVVAYLTGDTTDSDILTGRAVRSASTITLTFRNWLGAFLQAALAVQQADPSLGQELDLTTKLGNSATGIVEGVYSKTKFYQENQFGKVGQLIGSRIAQDSLRDVLFSGVGTASEETRRTVIQALDAGRSGGRVAAGSASVGLAVAQATTASSSVQNKADLSALDGLRGEVTQTLQGKADVSALDKARTDFTAAIGLKADVTAVDKARTDLTSAIALKADATALAGKADVSALDKTRTDLTAAIGLKADATALAGKADVSALDKTRTDLTAAIGLKADATALAGKADVSALDKARTDLTAAIGLKADATALAGKADVSALDKTRTDLTAAIGLKADTSALAGKADVSALDKVRTDLTAAIGLKADTSALATKADASALDRARADLTAAIGLKADQTTVDKNRADFTAAIALKADNSELANKADVAAVNQVKTDFTKALAAKADSATLDRLSTDLNTSIADLRKQVGTRANASDLQLLQSQVTAALAAKADASVVDKLRSDVVTGLSSKVDTATFDSRTAQINDKLVKLQRP